jgi:hypothetical protein
LIFIGTKNHSLLEVRGNTKRFVKKLFILERDGWKCQLCGCDTPRELRGTTDPRAPEVGHIIPRTRGGGEEDSNLRCECKNCNRQKSGFLDYELEHVVFTPTGPESVDFVAVYLATEAMREGQSKGGIAGGRKGGLIGGRRNIELNGNPGTVEGRKKGGRACGRKAVESGHLGLVRAKGGRAGGRRTAHLRWHVARNILSVNCPLCVSPSFDAGASIAASGHAQ